MAVSITERVDAQPNEQRFRVIDLDSHVMEPESMWAEYLPARYRELAPRAVIDGEGYRHNCLGGVTLGRGLRSQGTPPPVERGGFDPQARLDVMDAEGIEAMVLYPTTGLSTIAAIRDIEFVVAFCQAYNNWVNDFRAVAPRRLLPMAAVPQRSVVETLAETRRAVGELGMPGIYMRPNKLERTLDDPAWEPLWSLLEELDVPLGIHEGTGSGAKVGAFGEDRTENPMFLHMMSHPFEHMQAMLQLICGGVLERHPNLRVCFVEAGCGWVPYWLERMEHHMREWAQVTFPLTMSPTEYFLRQCFVSADTEEDAGLTAVLSTVGPEGICWSTDYPHPDHTWKGIARSFTDRDDLTHEVKAKVAGGNAVRAYKL
jgi:predicted TIM-barrel fold metal-dependent hydrolase